MHPHTRSRRPGQHYSVLSRIPVAAPPSTAERIAETMIALNTDGGATRERLLDTYTAEDLDQHGAEARRIANGRFNRRDDGPAPYDRAARIEKGAQLVMGLLLADEGEVHATLRRSGYNNAELNDIKPDIVDRAAQLVVEAGASRRVQ